MPESIGTSDAVDDGEPRYAVVSPIGRSTRTEVALNSRLPEPDGKRIAFIWDHVFRGDEIFELVQRELSGEFPTMEFVQYTAFGNIHGEHEREAMAEIPEVLRATKTDAVIVGVGA